MARLASYPTTVIQSGLHRGRGETGKLRPYGSREREAVRRLVDKGLVAIVRADSHGTTHHGHTAHHYEMVIRAIPREGIK